MNKVLIEIRGGIVQQITTNNNTIEVNVIDWDNVEQGQEGFTYFRSGGDEQLNEKQFETLFHKYLKETEDKLQ